jgi:hypothetical protein
MATPTADGDHELRAILAAAGPERRFINPSTDSVAPIAISFAPGFPKFHAASRPTRISTSYCLRTVSRWRERQILHIAELIANAGPAPA